MHNPEKTWPYSIYLDACEFNIHLISMWALIIHSSSAILHSYISEDAGASMLKPTHLSLVYSRD